MATIKSYTDLEQSKKLAEILPIESADMCWTNHCYGNIRSSITVSSKTIEEYKELLERFADLTDIDVFYPCWSLAALLKILPEDDFALPNLRKENGRYSIAYSNDELLCVADNPVDACVSMILDLHKNNML
jgi:hypothetical protein